MKWNTKRSNIKATSFIQKCTQNSSAIIWSPTHPYVFLWHIFSRQLVMTGGFMFTITWTTKSFWILASCRRVLSVRSFPEKNHLWRDTSMSSCPSSCFFSSAIESAMLAVRRTSSPGKSSGHQQICEQAARLREALTQSRDETREVLHLDAVGLYRLPLTCWQSHTQLELLPARRRLHLLLCGVTDFVFAGCFRDEVDRRSESVRRQLVAVAQFIITLSERACRGRSGPLNKPAQNHPSGRLKICYHFQKQMSCQDVDFPKFPLPSFLSHLNISIIHSHFYYGLHLAYYFYSRMATYCPWSVSCVITLHLSAS